jgi:signal peptidase I
MDAKHEHSGGGGMTTTGASAGGGGSVPEKREDGSIKELIISMAIALAMALVAKVFVIEAFVIPTGSMAPTLLGQHMVFRSEQTGREWTVNPWFKSNLGDYPVQSEVVSGGAGRQQVRVPVVTDPMTISRVTRGDYGGNWMIPGRGYTPDPQPKPLRAGDRILVQKLLYEVTSPKRWDVVVFKNPQDPTVNFIKRLAGLPNEQVWIADGDVFARPIEAGTQRGPVPKSEWRVQRKPARVQRSLWRPIFSSEFTPVDPVSASTGLRWFETPWSGEGWETGDGRSYRTESSAATVVSWDSERWPICDWEPYNDDRRAGPRPIFPVSDVRVRADVVPDGDGMRVAAVVRARQHEFRGEIAAGRALVRMRREGGNWETLGEGPAPVLRAGRVARVEFWHVDQTVEMWVDGKRVAHGEYAWMPEDRLEWVTGVSHAKDAESNTSLSNPASYMHGGAEVWWEFEGSAATLHRVGVDRDLYYQAAVFASGESAGRPAFGTHPRNLAATGPDQFYFLGDNSPASEDSRLWPRVDDEVSRQFDAPRGLVDRRMILGKAFFVYFPAPHAVQVGPVRLPVPDFGRLRWIK